MVLPPFRIGGVRGGATTLTTLQETLSAILSAIEDNTAAVNLLANQQAETSASIGLPGDTDCENTLLQSLCGILTALAGEGETTGAPPMACPGFPANPTAWTYADSWYLPETELTGPTGTAAPNWQSAGNMSTVLWEVYSPSDGDSVYTLSRFFTTTDGTNLCFSWEVRDGGYQFIASVFNTSDDSLSHTVPFVMSNEPSIGSYPVSFDADQYVVLQAHKAGGTVDTPPDATIWVVQGPFG